MKSSRCLKMRHSASFLLHLLLKHRGRLACFVLPACKCNALNNLSLCVHTCTYVYACMYVNLDGYHKASQISVIIWIRMWECHPPPAHTTPCRVMYLVSSLTTWEGLGGMALLKEACHWKWALSFQKPKPDPVLLSFPPSLLPSGWESRMQITHLLLRYHVCPLPAMAIMD